MAKEPLTDLEQTELELKKLELEERKQALESKKIHDELARLQLTGLKSDLEMKQNNKRRGIADAKKAIEDRKVIQGRCNHHAGGKYALAVTQGQGDHKRGTCVGAQQFLDGTFRVLCLRCFKEWRSDYPNGDAEKGFGPWNEGVELWRDSENTEIMVIGGFQQTKKQELPAA